MGMSLALMIEVAPLLHRALSASGTGSIWGRHWANAAGRVNVRAFAHTIWERICMTYSHVIQSGLRETKSFPHGLVVFDAVRRHGARVQTAAGARVQIAI